MTQLLCQQARPLDGGLRVLDLSRAVSGPFAVLDRFGAGWPASVITSAPQLLAPAAGRIIVGRNPRHQGYNDTQSRAL